MSRSYDPGKRLLILHLVRLDLGGHHHGLLLVQNDFRWAGLLDSGHIAAAAGKPEEGGRLGNDEDLDALVLHQLPERRQMFGILRSDARHAGGCAAAPVTEWAVWMPFSSCGEAPADQMAAKGPHAVAVATLVFDTDLPRPSRDREATASICVEV